MFPSGQHSIESAVTTCCALRFLVPKPGNGIFTSCATKSKKVHSCQLLQVFALNHEVDKSFPLCKHVVSIWLAKSRALPFHCVDDSVATKHLFVAAADKRSRINAQYGVVLKPVVDECPFGAMEPFLGFLCGCYSYVVTRKKFMAYPRSE